MFIRISCAQVHELPLSHYGDNREVTFLHIYIYIYIYVYILIYIYIIFIIII